MARLRTKASATGKRARPELLVVDPATDASLRLISRRNQTTCLFVDRGPLPYLRAERFSLSRVFRYYETIGLLSSRHHLVSLTISARRRKPRDLPGQERRNSRRHCHLYLHHSFDLRASRLAARSPMMPASIMVHIIFSSSLQHRLPLDSPRGASPLPHSCEVPIEGPSED